MSDIERKARKLRELIDQYWSLAYAEGEQRRNHDTEDGDAQRVSMDIDRAIRDIAFKAPAGYVLMPVKINNKMIATGNGWMMGPTVMQKLWQQLLDARPEVK